MLKGILIAILTTFQFVNIINAFESIPFEMVGNLIIISTTVDGKTGDFIVDTGVPIVFLNKEHFEGKSSEKVMHGINGEGGMVSTKYSKIEIGSFTWNSVYCEITDLTALESALGRPILGLIGCQLFNRYIVEFDYKNKELRLSLFNSQVDPSLTKNTSRRTYKCKGNIPVIDAKIGSQNLKLIIDTGSAYNILRTKDLGKLDSHNIKWDHQRLVGLGQGELSVQAATIFDLEVGGKVCAPMKTLFSADEHLQMLCPGQSVDGILGSEYLQQIIMTIDFKRNTVTFLDHEDSLKNEFVRK